MNKTGRKKVEKRGGEGGCLGEGRVEGGWERHKGRHTFPNLWKGLFLLSGKLFMPPIGTSSIITAE